MQQNTIAEQITTRDVQKGDIIICRDGTRATVLDNARGVIRRVEVPSLFGQGTDSGSQYVREWQARENADGSRQRITLTEAQQTKLNRIARAGF